MHTTVFFVILSTSSCYCYAGYELFQGFNATDVDDTTGNTYSSLEQESTTFRLPLRYQQNATTFTTMQPNNENASTTNTLSTISTISNMNRAKEQTSLKQPIESTTLKPINFECPEEETPLNIGPYEVPTQRDIVYFTRNIIVDMFNTYNREAFYLLKDIAAATKATSSFEKNCERRKKAYKQCVKRVSKQCQQITKNLVKNLENQKQEILNLTQVKICKLSDMRTDPIKMLKSLAQQKVSLEFALPGFLRLLNSCSLICLKPEHSTYKYKPIRHLTDQELVIKHFLTGKNYLELIMDSSHKTIANSN